MTHKRYDVFVEPSADKRLADHIEFLARVSEKAATQLYDAYEEALSFLEGTPESCPLYFSKTLVNEELRFKMFYKRYRIVFEVIGNEVYAYDIQDCRQDDERNLV